jgi:hypothetical protein
MLVMHGQAWGDVWTSGQTPDSIAAAQMNHQTAAYDSLNYGVYIKLSSKWNSTVPERDFLIRPALKSSNYSADSTQDSSILHLFIDPTTKPNNDSDTVVVYFYVMKTDWVEGTKNIDTGYGMSCWKSAKWKVTDWNTGGALSTTDHEATVACSLKMCSAMGWTTTMTDTVHVTVKIPGSFLTSNFINYGLLGVIGRVDGYAFSTVAFWSDDWTTRTYHRPYFETYQSYAGAPAATVLPIGTTKFGTVKLAPPQ